VAVGLGTDGPAGSNNDLNVMENGGDGSRGQAAEGRAPRPECVQGVPGIEMATISGARALHMESEIGSLEGGKKADVIVLNPNVPHGVPLFDLHARSSIRSRPATCRRSSPAAAW
jgi:5-methylthioadenosine/S-adenosylhomocysteine deaminase